MAAFRLMLEWCEAHGADTPVAVTVDHGLRKASAGEAKQVANWARKAGARHATLRWDGARPTGNIQAEAREARYRLIGAWAASHNIKTLVTGHTLDDQAETFLLRLARGSGLEGLSGMAPIAPFPLRGFDGLTIARPLLGFSHAQLIATLQLRKQAWFEDPSNDATRFERVRIRGAKGELEALGLTPERLAQTAVHLGRAGQAIDTAVAALLAGATNVSPWGYVLVRGGNFAAAPREVALRALSRLIVAVGGEPYPPRFEVLDAACTWLMASDTRRGRTLGGCRLARRGEEILIAREEAAVAPIAVRLSAGKVQIWDGRFRVSLKGGTGHAFTVEALGAKGLAQAGPAVQLPPVEPRLIAKTTPALWTGGRVIIAPLLGYCADEFVRTQFSVAFLGLAKGKGAAKGNGL